MSAGLVRILRTLVTRTSVLDTFLRLTSTSSTSSRSAMSRKAPLHPREYGQDPNLFLTQPGSGERTFMYDEDLPSLPVPKLEQTLNRYLDSVKPFLSESEFSRTESLVKEFGEGVGKQLHEKLLKRAAERRNWLEEWWLNEAYLRFRLPLAPYCNPSEIGVCTDHYWPPKMGTQLERCALHMYFTARVWLHLRKEEVLPEGRGPVKVTMNQLRNLFCSVQSPGEEIDSVQINFKTESEGPGYGHVVVLCNGHFAVLHLLAEDGRQHTPPELLQRLRQIKSESESEGPGVGAMTALPRTDWWKLRKHLSSLHGENVQHLDVIDTAICMYCLDMSLTPYTNTETLALSLGGDVTNRWFDKCINYIVSPNGVMTSNTVHSPADGIAMITVNRLMQHYIYQCAGVWNGDEEIRDSPRTKKMIFHVDETILNGVQRGKTLHRQSVANISVFSPSFHLFGKELLKTLRVHPDTFIQLALQLAYYKLHGRAAPTYETATTRQFYHGRTETVRSSTLEALIWCRTMIDPNRSNEERYEALKKARDKQDWLMRECCNAQGCDRHLTGLRMIAAEAGMAQPQIYSDPAWKKSGGDGNFVLSTSLSGYSLALGGMPPMMETGYGVFYRIQDSSITLIMTSFKSCRETSERDLYGHLQSCMLEMRDLLVRVQPPYAKL